MSDSQSRRYILEALQSLPAKRRNKNLVGNLQSFSDHAERSQAVVAQAINGSARMKLVFPDMQLSSATEKISSARRKAKSCLRDLSQSIDAVAKPTFESRLIEMKDHATASIRLLNEAWQKRLGGVVEPYETIVVIVKEHKLQGSEALVAAIEAIKRAQGELPSTNEGANTIKKQITGLSEIITSLGLTGRVGEFLIAVSNGSGSPRDLEVKEIREFLDKYALWNSLRVSF